MAKKVNKLDNKPLKLGPEDVVALKATLRPGGRPLGSRNKIGREIRDLAQKYTLRAVRAAWKLARNADSEDTQLKAIQMLLAYGHGRPVDRQEVSGAGGTPLHPPEYSDREWARRIACLLTKPGSGGEGVVAELMEGTEGSAPASTPGTPPAGSSGGKGVGGGSAASSPSRGNGAADSFADGRGGAAAPAAVMVPTEEPVKNLSPENPSPPEISSRVKTAPEAGESAFVGQFEIRCIEPSRPNLPLQHEIRMAIGGQLMTAGVNGFNGALGWVRHRAADGEDLEVRIRATVVENYFDSPRPDQYEVTPPGRPEVSNAYGNRKRGR